MKLSNIRRFWGVFVVAVGIGSFMVFVLLGRSSGDRIKVGSAVGEVVERDDCFVAKMRLGGAWSRSEECFRVGFTGIADQTNVPGLDWEGAVILLPKQLKVVVHLADGKRHRISSDSSGNLLFAIPTKSSIVSIDMLWSPEKTIRCKPGLGILDCVDQAASVS